MSGDVRKDAGSELILIAAANQTDLVANVRLLVDFLVQAPDVSLHDVAWTCAVKSSEIPFSVERSVLALVTTSVADLRSRLESALVRIENDTGKIRDRSGTYYFKGHLLGPGTDGKLAFVFPGASSYYPDMISDIVLRFPECRKVFDELEQALAGNGLFSARDFIFPPAPQYYRDAGIFGAGGYAEALVSCGCANFALAHLLESLGIRADGVTGMQGGEISALYYAGMLGDDNLKKRISFIHDLYHVVQDSVQCEDLPKCVIATVLASDSAKVREVVSSFSDSSITLVFESSSKCSVYAISSVAYPAIRKALLAAGARIMILPADRPFNTPWAAPILKTVSRFVTYQIKERAKLPLWNCATASLMPEKRRHVRSAITEAWVKPIRFRETVVAMQQAGYRVFLEVGPRGLLSSAVSESLKGTIHAAFAVDGIHRSGLVQFQHAVANLAALGATVDARAFFVNRTRRLLDFTTPFACEVRANIEKPLIRGLPRFVLNGTEPMFGSFMSSTASSTPGARNKNARRAAADEARKRRKQQFDFGAAAPLISDAEIVERTLGISVEVVKTFSFDNEKLIPDFAFAAAQISYSSPELRGLTTLPIPVGLEIMAELAQYVVPNRHVVGVEGLDRRRAVFFDNGKLRLRIRAERVASPVPEYSAVKVQIRTDTANSTFTWPALEGTFLLAAEPPKPAAFIPEDLSRPRNVHWTNRDIYPDRLTSGELLRHITKADVWSEGGMDYEVEVPSRKGALAHTPFPLWVINPQLLAAVLDGFSLWRGYGRFAGALSFPFRLRHLSLHVPGFAEGSHYKCYIRLAGVTPHSHVADIRVSDGKGNLVMAIDGYEEFTERMPLEYTYQMLSPVSSYLTKTLPPEAIGIKGRSIGSAFITDIPYHIFERHDEIWLKAISKVVLERIERKNFKTMTGSAGRRTEWLYGRIAAKEAVRRYLNDNYHARWADADINIWANEKGKPIPLGKWRDFLAESTTIDLAIAHTSQFVVAIVAANMKVGIDVEDSQRDLSEEFIRAAFDPAETEIAAAAVDSPSALIRFWCAKEAFSKALGVGIVHSPKEMTVDSFSSLTGEMQLSLHGDWLKDFKYFTGRSVRASSVIVKGHVLVTCFLPEVAVP